MTIQTARFGTCSTAKMTKLLFGRKRQIEPNGEVLPRLSPGVVSDSTAQGDMVTLLRYLKTYAIYDCSLTRHRAPACVAPLVNQSTNFLISIFILHITSFYNKFIHAMSGGEACWDSLGVTLHTFPKWHSFACRSLATVKTVTNNIF